MNKKSNIGQLGHLEQLLTCPYCNSSLLQQSISPEFARNISELKIPSKDDVVIKTGDWKLHDNPQALSSTQIMSNKEGDKVSYSFYGNHIIVYFLRCDWSGIAEIIVDGTSIKKIDLYSPNYEFGYPCIIDTGSDKHHIIDIVVTSQKNPHSIDNQIWIDGFGCFTTEYDTIYYCENCKKQFPVIKGIIDFTKSDDELVCMYNAFIASSGDEHYGFNQLPEIAKVGHFLRMDILDNLLDEQTIKNAVVIDIGCGPWGFACIYPKLQKCRVGIGIDISLLALIRSIERCGNHYYIASSEKLPLKNESVDIIFAGEVIEHVVNPQDFIDDVDRVLKEKGVFVLTTPNPKPFFYKLLGKQYAESPEHISLLRYKTLKNFLDSKFVIETAIGINLSFFPWMDERMKNKYLLRGWSKIFRFWPDNATGFIIKCRKKGELTK